MGKIEKMYKLNSNGLTVRQAGFSRRLAGMVGSFQGLKVKKK